MAWRNLKGLAELANLTVLHHVTCTKTFTQEVCGMEDLKFVWYGESKYELMYLFEKPVHTHASSLCEATPKPQNRRLQKIGNLVTSL